MQDGNILYFHITQTGLTVACRVRFPQHSVAGNVLDSCAMLRAKIGFLVFVGVATLFGNAVASFAQTHWVASWATSPQVAEDENALQASELREGTLRQILHLSIGGAQLRV